MILQAVSFILLANCLLANGLKSANCTTPRATLSAPTFKGADNLSSEGCGVWEQATNPGAPWRVAIRTGNSTCYATLISPTTAFSWACSTQVYEFTYNKNKSASDFQAHLGKCHDKNLPNCTDGNAGQRVQVEGVTTLKIPTLYSLAVWKIKPVRVVQNQVSPICLFNKDNRKDFNAGETYFGFKWNPSRGTSAQLVEDITTCLPENISNEQCKRLNHSLCARYSSAALHQYLVQEASGRFFLRGVEDYRGKDMRHEVFTDLLPHLEEIVSKSTGLTLTAAAKAPRTNA